MTGEVAGLDEPLEIPICGAPDLPMVLTSVAQDKERYGVLVDFSAPDAVMENYKQAIAFGIRPIIGTPPPSRGGQTKPQLPSGFAACEPRRVRAAPSSTQPGAGPKVYLWFSITGSVAAVSPQSSF